MANECSFQMIIKGERKNVVAFLKALEQEDDYCLGRGAEILGLKISDKGEYCVDGWCKWSVYSSLYENALEAKFQKKTGKGRWYDGDGFITNHIIVDIVEATELWNLEIEIASWESGMGFSEHYIIREGEWMLDDVLEYYYEYDDEFDEYVEVGGYPSLF